MRIYKEVSDRYDFNFWSGAKDTVNTLRDDDVEHIIGMLEETSEEMSETELNDFFWFETEEIANWLGWEDWDTLSDAYENGIYEPEEWDDFLNEQEEADEDEEDEEEDEDED